MNAETPSVTHITASAERGQSELRELLAFVRRLARRMCRRLPSSVAVDDMVSAGNEGLVQALRSFDDARGVRFTTFARHRIVGAMLDELQRIDTMSRTARRRQRRLEACAAGLTARLGREPREAELAAAVGLPIDRYRKWKEQARETRIVYLSHGGDGDDRRPHELPDPGPDPETLLADSDLRARVRSAMDELPVRHREVVRMYFEQEMTLTQVGAVLGVTESRACQLKSQATRSLRTVLMRDEPSAMTRGGRPGRGGRVGPVHAAAAR
jgi:RNA polymerase sigma factor FliA